MRKQVYIKFAVLALPIILQQLISQSLVFVDQMMIGHLGKEVIAAIGTSNQISFLYGVIAFGISSSGSIFISQYHGKKEHGMTRRIFGFVTVILFLYSVIFMIITLFLNTSFFALLYENSIETQRVGVAFTKIIAYTFPIAALSFSFSSAMRSVEHTTSVMIATTVSVFINIFANIILIPMYGAVGSAYGTLLARIVELGILLALHFVMKTQLYTTDVKEYWISNKVVLRKLWRISWPVLLNELLWAATTVTINLLYTQTGVSGAAASTISNLVISIESIIFMGLASGTAILIGKVIGEQDDERTQLYARYMTQLSIGLALFLVIGLYLIGIPLIMSIYDLEPQTELLTKRSMYIVTFMSFFKLLNWYLFIGLFRAGGDTYFALFADVSFLIGYALPAVLIGLYVFHFPVDVLILLTLIEELFKLALALWRYQSKKWIHNVTREMYY